MVLKGALALLAGALASAIATTLIFAVILVVAPDEIPGAPEGPNPFLPYLLPSSAFFMFIVFFITAAHAFILGGPLALVLINSRLVRWWICILAGFVIGLPIMLVTIPNLALWGGGLGAVGGFTAWLVWSILNWRSRAAASPVPEVQLAEPPASA